MLREIVILLVLVTGYSSKKIDYVDTLVGTGGNGYGYDYFEFFKKSVLQLV
jgi:hypothetical protein